MTIFRATYRIKNCKWLCRRSSISAKTMRWLKYLIAIFSFRTGISFIVTTVLLNEMRQEGTLGIVKEHKWQFLIFSFIIWSQIVLVIREDFYAKILTITKPFHVRNVVRAFILMEFCTLSNMSFIKYIKYFAKHVCVQTHIFFVIKFRQHLLQIIHAC